MFDYVRLCSTSKCNIPGKKAARFPTLQKKVEFSKHELVFYSPVYEV